VLNVPGETPGCWAASLLFALLGCQQGMMRVVRGNLSIKVSVLNQIKELKVSKKLTYRDFSPTTGSCQVIII